MINAVKIIVSGKVQGVGFRFYTHKKAQELGILGCVKNQRDGTVLIEAMADNDKLETFIDWCRLGPEWANVINIQIQSIPVFTATTFAIK